MADIIPDKGERAAIFGMTGSGKTGFACWLLKRLSDVCVPVIIYDTKIEPKFEALPNSTVVEDINAAYDAVQGGEFDYIIVRPNIHVMNDPVTLDKWLLFHYSHMQGTTAYIDEAYTFHRNSQAGPGLTALMTRGRSKGITTILSAQRPARISRFLITECNSHYIFRLRDKQDRQRIDDVSEDFSKRDKLEPYFFYFIQGDDSDNPILYSPITLDPEMQSGYTDNIHNSGGDADDEQIPGIWI